MQRNKGFALAGWRIAFVICSVSLACFLQATEPQDHDLEYVSFEISIEKDVVSETEQDSQFIVLTAAHPVADVVVVHLDGSGSAEAGLDYDLDRWRVVIPPGSQSQFVRFEPIRDWVEEEDEVAEIQINRIFGPGKIGSASRLSITIEDDDDGDGNRLSEYADIVAFTGFRQEADSFLLSTFVSNVGFLDSAESTLSVALWDNLEFDGTPVYQESDQVESLEGLRRSFYSRWFEIDIGQLKASRTYFGQILVESVENESFTYNNDDYFGFTLDADKQMVVTCDTGLGASVTGEDPLFEEQWHLVNKGQKAFAANSAKLGEDIHMKASLNEGLTGKGIRIAIVDTGLEICHPDLHQNIELEQSFNFRTSPSDFWYLSQSKANDPFNPNVWGDHGTSVAGVAAATSDNGIGVRGVAPGALIRGFNFLETSIDSSLPDSLGASNSEPSSADVDVFNMSFGRSGYSETEADTYRLFEFGTTDLRDGKGAVYVKSAGNGWRSCNSIYHPVHSAIGCRHSGGDPINRMPYTIGVTALDANGQAAPYSSSGSNVWLAAPAGWWGRNQPALLTTDQIGPDRGYHNFGTHGLQPNHADSDYGNFVSNFNGTSGAAAVVSGVIALLLEAEPKLTWRDVKYILAKTARPVHTDINRVQLALQNRTYTIANAWVVNGAGYAFHNRFGFGSVNVDAAIALAREHEPNSLGAFKKSDWFGPGRGYFREPIPDASARGEVTRIDVTSPRDSGVVFEAEVEAFARSNIEYIVLRVTLAHGDYTQLGITVTSPQGTESIVNPIFNNSVINTDDSILGVEWEFASSAFYGESPVGLWEVKVVDVVKGVEGVVRDVDLRMYYGSHP